MHKRHGMKIHKKHSAKAEGLRNDAQVGEIYPRDLQPLTTDFLGKPMRKTANGGHVILQPVISVKQLPNPDHNHVTAAMLGLLEPQGPFITTIQSALS